MKDNNSILNRKQLPTLKPTTLPNFKINFSFAIYFPKIPKYLVVSLHMIEATTQHKRDTRAIVVTIG